MERHHRRLALLLAVALMGAACGGGGQEGGEDGGTIPIGGIFDLTGATSDVGVPYSEGVRGYVEWLNGQGGIDGRRIDLMWEDYAYDVARAEQVYSRLRSEGVVGIQGWGTGDTEALRGRITTDQVPFMSASYAETLVDPAETPFNFVVATTYSDQMRIALQWIAEDAGGPTEVAVFHHDSPFGESPLEGGSSYIQEQGLDIGYETYPMPTEATDFVSELSQAGEQGAEYIVIQNVSTPAAQLANDVAQQGLDMKIVCLNWCADELFVDLAGDAAEGVVGVMPFAPATVDAPGFEEPASFLEEEGATLEEKTLHYAQGWYTMAVMTEAVRQVLDGGGEVTGTSLREALESMPTFETGDVTAPIDFSADSHAGMTSSRMFQVSGGSWTELTDYLSP
jgi:branched-chain amino acid transport system substrate-binding protein